MRQAIVVLRYAFWPALVLAPWLIVLSRVPPRGQVTVQNPLFTYFLTFVLVVGVILSLILRHLIQRSKRRPLDPAKVYTFMEDVLRMDPTAERFHEAGVFCCETGQWDRAIEYLSRVGSEDRALENSARYHLLIAYLESARTDEAARLQAELPPDALTTDQRYNVALAYKKHDFLGRAKELFLKLFLMDIGFRDVGKQLEEINTMEQSRQKLPAAYGFLAGAISERYADLAVLSDPGKSVVCTAHDRDLGRTVVLRALKPDYTLEDEIAAFLREARELAAYDHPAILKVYDIRKDRLPYFSTEPFEGQPASALGRLGLTQRVTAVGRMLDLAEHLGGFDVQHLLAGDRGDIRLTSIAPAPRSVPYAFLAGLLAEPGEVPPGVEHALKGATLLLEARAPVSEARRGIEVLDTALRLDAEARERAEFSACLRFVEQVHRHYIHALKSKFAVVRRFPGEPEKALAIFGREENLSEIDRMLSALGDALAARRGAMPAAPKALVETAGEIGSLDVAGLRRRVGGIRELPQAEAAQLLTGTADRFVALSAGIARLLETLEVDLGALVGGVVRGSVYAPMIRAPGEGERIWSVRTVDPAAFRNDLTTSIENILHNAFEAGARSVDARLGRLADGRFLTIVLEDDGRGFDSGVIERLARERYSDKSGGTGTGLTSSMRLLERHGGMLELCNRTGTRGARALVTLPTMSD